jgi:hypothetical protein
VLKEGHSWRWNWTEGKCLYIICHQNESGVVFTGREAIERLVGTFDHMQTGDCCVLDWIEGEINVFG